MSPMHCALTSSKGCRTACTFVSLRTALTMLLCKSNSQALDRPFHFYHPLYANLPALARALFASGSFTFAYTRSRSRQMERAEAWELARQGRSRAEVLIGLLEPALRYASRFEPEHELHVCCARDTAVTRGARYACPRRVPDWHWCCVWQASSEW